jgi:predicted nucleic acid-binding protein
VKVLVDTPIWSLALRRKHRPENASIQMELASLIADGRVAIIGPIRQELLSGIKERAHFDRLRDHLRAFPDTEITSDDYEGAAWFYNICRAKGIQGSNTDFLICAIAARNEFSIFTTDADFTHFARVLPIELHDAGRKTTQSP